MKIALAFGIAFILTMYCFKVTAQNLPKVKSGGIVRLANFKSEYVDARHIDIWLPKGYTNKQKYAVLYMHDGQMLYDATTTWNKTAWEVADVATKLIEDNEVNKFIIVGIWNNNNKRHLEYFPQTPFDLLTKAEKDKVTTELKKAGRITEGFKPISDNYLKFLVTELKPYIDNNYATLTKKENTFIAGSSMGALISIYALCEYPNIFGGAACLSTHWPGIFTVNNNPVPNAFASYLKQNLPSPKNHKIYFDYGDQTLDSLYKPLQQNIDTLMAANGYTSKNWITKYFAGQNHSEKAWSSRLHIPLVFLLKK